MCEERWRPWCGMTVCRFPYPARRGITWQLLREFYPKSGSGCPQITQMNADFQQVVTDVRLILRVYVTMTATPS